MIFDVLKNLGLGSTKDYIEGERKSAPDLNNPEVMNQFLQDLIINISGGGIAGSVKTGGKYIPNIVKEIQRYFKFLNKNLPTNLSSADDVVQILKKLETRGKGGVSLSGKDIKTVEKFIFDTSKKAYPLVKTPKPKIIREYIGKPGQLFEGGTKPSFVTIKTYKRNTLKDILGNIQGPETVIPNIVKHPLFKKLMPLLFLSSDTQNTSSTPNKTDNMLNNLINPDSLDFPPLPAFLGGPVK